MTETYEMTEKEAKLAECGEICFDDFQDPTLGYYNVDGDPALLCFTLEQALETTDFTKHQIAGLIGSLEEKGILWIEHRDHQWEGPDLFWLSENFCNWLATENQKKEAVK